MLPPALAGIFGNILRTLEPCGSVPSTVTDILFVFIPAACSNMSLLQSTEMDFLGMLLELALPDASVSSA